MSVLLTIAGVHLVGLVVPGPNVLSVSQAAVARSRPAAVAVALGVATAALIWAATAAAGLALVLSTIGGLGILLRAVGAAVLIVLGVRLIADREAAATAGESRVSGGSLGRFFGKGILVNLSNPKSLVYYTSVFTALIPADASPAIRLAAVVIVVGESVTWHSLLALLFSRERPRRLDARLGARIERSVGGIFVFFGARLLWAATR
jgi:threonine/homoserine/homoserine lactone efflux protein